MPIIEKIVYYRGLLTPNVGEPSENFIFPFEANLIFDLKNKSLTIIDIKNHKVTMDQFILKTNHISDLKDFTKNLKGIKNTYQKEMDSGGLFESENLTIFYEDVNLVSVHEPKFYYFNLKPWTKSIDFKTEDYKTNLDITKSSSFFDKLINDIR